EGQGLLAIDVLARHERRSRQVVVGGVDAEVDDDLYVVVGEQLGVVGVGTAAVLGGQRGGPRWVDVCHPYQLGLLVRRQRGGIRSGDVATSHDRDLHRYAAAARRSGDMARDRGAGIALFHAASIHAASIARLALTSSVGSKVSGSCSMLSAPE